MTGLEPYPEYKQSGIEWIGEIPAGWTVQRFRTAFRESSEVNGSEPIGAMLSISGYRGVEEKVYDDEGRRRTAEESVGYRVVRKGQLAVNTMWLNYGGLGVSELEGHVSPAYRSYLIDPGFEPRFVHHLMRSATYIDGYTALLTGIRPNSLQMSRDDLMDFPVLRPPADEQVEISTYLDRGTAEIDAFIADQEELIGLLTERRAATISHAVTTGIDPSAPMKQTRANWPSRVPNSWTATAVRHAFQVLDCKHVTVEVSNDGEFPLASIRQVKGEIVDLGGANRTDQKNFDLLVEGGREPRCGDLIVSRNASVGEVAIVPPGLERFAMGQDVSLIRDAQGAGRTRFLAYVLRSLLGKHAFAAASIGSTFKRINVDDIKSLTFWLPPTSEECRRIADYLDDELVELDAAISDSREAIALSKERRAALIAAAVTGQIDVRGAS